LLMGKTFIPFISSVKGRDIEGSVTMGVHAIGTTGS